MADQTTNVHSVRTDLVHTGFINSSRNNTSRQQKSPANAGLKQPTPLSQQLRGVFRVWLVHTNGSDIKTRNPNSTKHPQVSRNPREHAKSKPQHPYAFVNDPSAGSPTETLLRLLRPLNDQV